MPIASDWTIDTTNRRIYHSANTTVYTANELYSWLMETFDETSFLGFYVPMFAVTPTDYRLINGWTINEYSGYNSYQYLKGGSISTLGWDAATYTNGIYVLTFTTGTYTNCVTTDIGKTVVNGTSSGVLLDYDNTGKQWFVRRGTGTTWVNTTTSITAGTGGNTGGAPIATTGESLFTNLYTIGTLESTTTNTLYIEQNSTLVPSYWPAGHIDLLLKVRQASSFIDSGLARVYCREYTDLYSHYQVNLASGGRNPVPLQTSDDANNQTSSGIIGALTTTITPGSITRDIGDGAGLQPYDVEVDCGDATTLQQVYEFLKWNTSDGQAGKFYRSANAAYLEVVTAPYGTFAGGKLFGARGIWFKNIPGGYNKASFYEVIDANGITRTPPTTYNFSVTNIVNNSEVRIFKQSDLTELGGAENVGAVPSGLSNVTVGTDPDNIGKYKLTYNYTYTVDIPIFVVVFHTSYQALRPEATLKAVDGSLQVAQIGDRQYLNPV